MPHHFVNRPRFQAVERTTSSLRHQFTWESVNALVYLIGSGMFIWASVLFYPLLEERADRGAWVFFFASLLYLVVTSHDAYEVAQYQRPRDTESPLWMRSEVVSVTSYLLGTVLFAVGSLFFLSSIGRYDAGAWCFVLGSLLFVLGATMDVLQIVRASDLRTLQLMNLTALAFVTGSVLFTVASVPYLFTFDNTEDERTVDAFLATQFVIGSVLFLIGGLFNYRRAHLVIKGERIADGSAARA
jgi:predicted membrane channel-forming protein YqfA (hemolysin III family)